MGFVTKPILGNGIRHKTYFGEWGSSQNLFWGKSHLFWGMGFVTKPISGNGIRHKTYVGEWGSSQKLFWGVGFVTKPILGNGVRHKTYFGEWDSSQNLFWGMGFVTKPILGKIPFILGNEIRHEISSGDSSHKLCSGNRIRQKAFFGKWNPGFKLGARAFFGLGICFISFALRKGIP